MLHKDTLFTSLAKWTKVAQCGDVFMRHARRTAGGGGNPGPPVPTVPSQGNDSLSFPTFAQGRSVPSWSETLRHHGRSRGRLRGRAPKQRPPKSFHRFVGVLVDLQKVYCIY